METRPGAGTTDLIEADCAVLYSPAMAKQATSQPLNPAWTVRQLAEYLNVNERTVYRMAERGDLPAFKVGDAWRFRPEDIDGWIGAQRPTRNRTSTGKQGRR